MRVRWGDAECHHQVAITVFFGADEWRMVEKYGKGPLGFFNMYSQTRQQDLGRNTTSEIFIL